MNALSEFNQQSSKISRRCCLAHSLGQTVPEDCTTVAKATFVIVSVSTWQGNGKLIFRITQIVRSKQITLLPDDDFRGQITGY